MLCSIVNHSGATHSSTPESKVKTSPRIMCPSQQSRQRNMGAGVGLALEAASRDRRVRWECVG